VHCHNHPLFILMSPFPPYVFPLSSRVLIPVILLDRVFPFILLLHHSMNPFSYYVYSDIPAVVRAPPLMNAVVPQLPAPPVEPTAPARKRIARTPGLVATNATYLVPDHIRKKFMEGWTSHVPLTYLTDRGCLLKNKTSSAQDFLSYDPATGQVVATAKTLPDHGELELTFDEWHQAWRRLLDLIKTFFPEELHLWQIHHSFILNSENRAEMWPVYLAYDADIRRRTTQSSIDPSVFSIGIWNDLEMRYAAKKVLNLVQTDMKQHPERFYPPANPVNPPSYTPRNPSQASSFRNLQHPLPENPKSGRCIFCGDRSKTHTSRNCTAACYANGSPCHLARQEPSGARTSSSGRRYCYAWNGPTGCDQGTCRKGEHICTLCGTFAHNAQRCDVVA
jgi:hypothetical protein